jgi:hypothetical protein
VSCAMHRKRIEGAIYLELRKKLPGNLWQGAQQDYAAGTSNL